MTQLGQQKSLQHLARLKRCYVGAAMITFSLLLTFIALNLALGLWFKLRPTRSGGDNPSRFPHDKLALAYGEMPMGDVLGMLDETWNLMKLEAKPWVHYGEAEFAGSYVNVSKDGVRSNGRSQRLASSGKTFLVFTFGGSTMWGYGVPDNETIAAHLERLLQARNPGRTVEVRNYGRGYYSSSQELALFKSLLRRGEAPDAVVFLDGLNEILAGYNYKEDVPSFDQPMGMPSLVAMWEASGEPARTRLPAWLPLVELMKRVESRRAKTRHSPALEDQDEVATLARGSEDAKVFLRMYLVNRRIIELAATEAGITPYFFWQPVPLHAYDLEKHLFPPSHLGPRQSAAMRALYEMFPGREKAVVDLSALLENYEKPAFVDAHHYTPAVCRLIAEKMADQIVVTEGARE